MPLPEESASSLSPHTTGMLESASFFSLSIPTVFSSVNTSYINHTLYSNWRASLPPNSVEPYGNSPNNITPLPYETVEDSLLAGSIGINGKLISSSSIEQTDIVTGQQNFAVNLEGLGLAPSSQVQEAVQQITNSFVGSGANEDLAALNLQNYSPFESGVFTVGETGEFSFTWKFDGGGYQNGQLAWFSLKGMELLDPGSKLFIQEAARRALSNSEEGGIIFDDQSEGSQFSGVLGTSDSENFNSGEYRGSKTFNMHQGEGFALMLVPNGKVQDVYHNPSIEGDKRPLFSLATANPDDAFHTGQLADVFGDGTTFVMEDLRVDTGSDRDYNDWVFRVQGAIGYAALLKDVIAPNNQWQYSQFGQEVLSHVSTNDNPDKSVPGKPVRDPILPTPAIPLTSADQGSNNLNAPTSVESSPTQDVIDQVSNTDPTDIYQIPAQNLIGTQIEVLQGQVTVSYFSPSGQSLGSQVVSEGKQLLTLPNDISGDVLLKIDNANGATATYVLPGFESKAPEPFNIQFEFGDGLTDSQRTTIESAARSIESIIKQGLPSAIVDGKIIDDLNIKLSLTDLDGRDGTLAQTKNDYLRYGTLLPAQSIVQLDRADIAELEQSGRLFNVVQHELLHALGFGNLWEAKGLVDYAKTPFARYTGQNAITAFQDAGGSTSFIPLETSGTGSADLHWNEGLFGGEIMTNDLNSQNANTPISPVTIASLGDLGYQVNIDQATPNWRLVSSAPPDAESIFSEEDKQRLSELVAAAKAMPSSDIPAIIATVDPATISPTIWAHAERFDVNGEYYDWELITVGNWTNGHTIWNYVLDRMTHPSQLDNRSPGAKANDPRYWQFIVDRNRAFGIERPELIYEGEPLYLPRWNANYEQEQEEERKRREAELKQKEEEERKQREKLEEAYRQNGQGGLEWYLAKSLPEFSPNAPYETSVRDLVGSLVPDDYFRFTVSRPGYVTLYLEDLLADVDLYLYDSKNRLIAKSTRGGITDEKIIANLAAGTYLARVNSPTGITTDYNLRVRFDGIPSRTQRGNGSSLGGRRPTFSDPRIERIFTQARDKFTTEQWAQAQPRINQLENEKQQKQRELDALLAQAIAEQRARIYAQLDGVRNDIQGKVSGGADNVRNVINGVADGAINAVNSLVPGWLKDILDRIGLGDDVQNAQNGLRGVINDARNWLNSQVDSVRNQINGAVGQFIEMVKNAYMTGGEINQAIENAANWLKGETDRLANFLNDKIGEFKGQILGKLEWTRNIRTPDWARGWPINAPDWNLYDHAIVGLVNGLASGASNAVNSASNFFKDTVSVVKPLAQGAVAVIVDAIFGDRTGKLYNEINGVNQEIANIRNAVQKTINDQTAFYQKILNDFLGGLGQAKDFILGALMGEFNGSPSIWQTLLDTAIGMVPILGEIGDVRDLIAFATKFTNDPNEMNDPWNWVGVAGAGIGLVPVVGGAIKGVTKLARNADLIQEVRKLAPPIVEAVIDFARKADWNALGNQTANLWDETLVAVRNLASFLKEKASAFKDAIVPKLGVLQPQLIDGRYPDDGFLSQMIDNIDRIRSTGREKIKNAFAFIQGKLDELSVSSGRVLTGIPPFSQGSIRKFLDETESLGEGHVYQRHISTGDMVEDQRLLQGRLEARQRGSLEYYKDEFSMFWDKQSAVDAITQAVNSKYSEIDSFVKANPNKVATKDFAVSINSSDDAFGINFTGEFIRSPLTDIQLVIRTREDGTWFILTAYPII